MAVATLLPNGKSQFLDPNGLPLAAGEVYFYVPNTPTPKNTWQDPDATILNTNPVVLDSSGQAIIYGFGAYRQVVLDSAGDTIWDQLTASPLMSNNNLSDVSNAATALSNIGGISSATVAATYAPINSPTFTGIPAVPTAAADTNTTQAASTAMVQAAIAAAGAISSGIQGQRKNLKIINDGSNPNTVMNITADAVFLQNASTAIYRALGVSVSPASGTSGANGLDTGAIAPSTWYAIYLIYNGTTVAGLYSLSATAPTLPSGYTYYARVGWIRTDGSSNFLRVVQNNYRAQYRSYGGTMPLVASGAAGTFDSARVAVSLATFIPTTALQFYGTGCSFVTGGLNVNGMAVGMSSTTGHSNTVFECAPNSVGASGSFSGYLEDGNLYWSSGSAQNYIYCQGWEDA